MIFVFVLIVLEYKRTSLVARKRFLSDHQKTYSCILIMESWLTRSWFKFATFVFLLNVLQVGTMKTIKLYSQNSQLPVSVLTRVTTNNNHLSSVAHIMQTWVKRLSSATLELTVNLTVLPSYSKHILITDELYLNFTDRNRSHLAIQDVWIKDRSTERPLARVYLKMGKPGYQAINLGSILADWLKNSQSTGSLIIEIKPGIMTAKEIISLNPSPYLVAYTNRLNVLSVPKPVKCHSQEISVPTGEHMLPRNWRTKICSPLTDITFPFNASSVFDFGQAVRNYLSSNPRLISSKVLRNPSCCHALRSGSMNLRTPEGGVWLENAKITECGCQEV